MINNTVDLINTLYAAIAQTNEQHEDVPHSNGRIQMSIPGDENWESWLQSTGMRNADRTAVIALRVNGYGEFYRSCQTALNDLAEYFLAEQDEEQTIYLMEAA